MNPVFWNGASIPGTVRTIPIMIEDEHLSIAVRRKRLPVPIELNE